MQPAHAEPAHAEVNPAHTRQDLLRQITVRNRMIKSMANLEGMLRDSLTSVCCQIQQHQQLRHELIVALLAIDPTASLSADLDGIEATPQTFHLADRRAGIEVIGPAANVPRPDVPRPDGRHPDDDFGAEISGDFYLQPDAPVFSRAARHHASIMRQAPRLEADRPAHDRVYLDRSTAQAPAPDDRDAAA